MIRTGTVFSGNNRSVSRGFKCSLYAAFTLCVLILAGAGCSAPKYDSKFKVAQAQKEQSAPQKLREGDVIEIAFAGANSLNTVQRIRPDGRITLPTLGELHVAGLSPAELEKQITDKYSSQLLNSQVSVTVEASSYPVFVTGAVLRPGKVVADRPLTPLDAVMEAGGPDYTKANLKGVRVIRNKNGVMERHNVNLKQLMEGGEAKPFYLEPSDIVYVPERFVWF